jgi:saccharopine dehydrogenase-like NADP-dependent oxidoreductase
VIEPAGTSTPAAVRVRTTPPVSDGAARDALVVGSRGGVGQALLGLWAEHPALAGRRAAAGTLLLVDAEDGPPADVPGTRTLPAQALRSAAELAALVRAHSVGAVIDLAELGTLDCIDACAHAGASYLSTSFESWPHEPHAAGTLEHAQRLLPADRPTLPASSHLVGTGMNPGVVNALAFAALAVFAAKVGVAADPRALALYAILVTEEDTTDRSDGQDDAGRFASTWRPESCLEELHEPAAAYVRHGRPVALPHAPTAAGYRARCGDRTIEGMVVPHEELVTLGHRFPGLELAFVYRLPPAARRFLAAPPPGDPMAFPSARLYPPYATALTGRDRVGVLLCSERFGELWLGYDTAVEHGLRYGTNATELQVAAGVLAGWEQLGRVPGMHTVEELDGDRYLACVSALLGPPLVVHDPHAPVTPLPARRVA